VCCGNEPLEALTNALSVFELKRKKKNEKIRHLCAQNTVIAGHDALNIHCEYVLFSYSLDNISFLDFSFLNDLHRYRNASHELFC
jgi:hypothetical protein